MDMVPGANTRIGSRRAPRAVGRSAPRGASKPGSFVLARVAPQGDAAVLPARPPARSPRVGAGVV